MFPLKERIIGGYTFGEPTFYSKFHLGTDYKADKTPIYAPFDGTIIQTIPASQAPQGGNTLWFKPDNQDVIIRFLHLKSFSAKGHVTEGQQIAVSDNTGISDKPHLHLDISKHAVNIYDKSNFIDPEKFNWNPMLTFKLKLVTNTNWATLSNKIEQLKARILSGSASRLQLDITVQNTNFVNIPYENYSETLKGVSRAWFKANIRPLGAGFDGVMLLIPLSDWQGSQGISGYSFFDDGFPQEIQVAADENMTTGGQGNPDLPMFVAFAEHELDHTFRQITGQETPTDNPNLVHDYISKGKFNDILATVDYDKLATLIKGAIMQPIFKAQGSATLYFGVGNTLVPFASDFPTYQIDFASNPIVELPASEFAKFKVATGVVVTKK